MAEPERRLRSICDALLRRYGSQGWWPSESEFETIVGAVLTQGTTWRNAEIAVAALKAAGLVDPRPLAGLARERVQAIIRPAGFYRRKAGTILALARAAVSHPGGLEAFLNQDCAALRAALLSITGVGPETADAILLYAAGKPVFVVDEYARRLAVRHGLAPARASYRELRTLFERAMPRDPRSLGECHALVVRVGKEHCRPAPLCRLCPAAFDLAGGGPSLDE